MATERADSSFADVSLTPMSSGAKQETAVQMPTPAVGAEGDVAGGAGAVGADTNPEPEMYGIYRYYDNMKKQFYSSNVSTLDCAVGLRCSWIAMRGSGYL